ncbi:MAG TPA: hypothetical protein DEA56_08695 [Eubacterium sp.]|nr:hypothetical protein [Eubacterium sp.]
MYAYISNSTAAYKHGIISNSSKTNKQLIYIDTSPQYSHIVGLSSHFYAHIGAGPKVFHPHMSKLMWVYTF